jgi:hypothetical protein
VTKEATVLLLTSLWNAPDIVLNGSATKRNREFSPLSPVLSCTRVDDADCKRYLTDSPTDLFSYKLDEENFESQQLSWIE